MYGVLYAISPELFPAKDRGTGNGLTATSTCQMVGPVGWFVPPDQIGHTPVDVTATTVNRRPRVEVRIPKHYWPSTAALSDLRGDVVSHLPRTDACS